MSTTTFAQLAIVLLPTAASFSIPLNAGRNNVRTLRRLAESKDGNSPPNIKPDILLPFPPAADPSYMCTGPVGQNDFIVSREGPPQPATELSNSNILKIVTVECSDLEVNTLVWKCLGYRYMDGEGWQATECFPNWREKFPEPPDLIGPYYYFVPFVVGFVLLLLPGSFYHLTIYNY